MTRVQPWVQAMVEDVMGGPPVEIGKYYTHPDHGLIQVTAGQYWGEHGLSNFWYWTIVESGRPAFGYGGDWPEASAPSNA